jgi:hypothetical protein
MLLARGLTISNPTRGPHSPVWRPGSAGPYVDILRDGPHSMLSAADAAATMRAADARLGCVWTWTMAFGTIRAATQPAHAPLIPEKYS